MHLVGLFLRRIRTSQRCPLFLIDAIFKSSWSTIGAKCFEKLFINSLIIEKIGAPERIRTSDLCLRRAAQCNSSALAVTATSPKTPENLSMSNERHEAGYRL